MMLSMIALAVVSKITPGSALMMMSRFPIVGEEDSSTLLPLLMSQSGRPVATAAAQADVLSPEIGSKTYQPTLLMAMDHRARRGTLPLLEVLGVRVQAARRCRSSVRIFR